MARFVRFRSQLRDVDLSIPLGVFYAADRLIASKQMDPWSINRAAEICDWFDRHLTVPCLRPGSRRAVFWFRSERREMIQRLWELANLLEECGAVVEFVQTARPGWVRYEDEFQVAAIPTRR